MIVQFKVQIRGTGGFVTLPAVVVVSKVCGWYRLADGFLRVLLEGSGPLDVVPGDADRVNAELLDVFKYNINGVRQTVPERTE